MVDLICNEGEKKILSYDFFLLFLKLEYVFFFGGVGEGKEGEASVFVFHL